MQITTDTSCMMKGKTSVLTLVFQGVAAADRLPTASPERLQLTED